MTESRREILLMVRVGNKKPAKKGRPGSSGLKPFRIFDSMEQADTWIETHPTGFSIVKFEVVISQVEEGLQMVFYDPNGGFEKWKGIISPGLYHSLKTGNPMIPDTEMN